jgi:hypothetical protein
MASLPSDAQSFELRGFHRWSEASSISSISLCTLVRKTGRAVVENSENYLVATLRERPTCGSRAYLIEIRGQKWT